MPTSNQPIDRGWAWVVMAATMLSTFLENGLYKSFGIFFVEYVKKFGSNATMTSVVSGIFLGTYSFCALIILTIGLRKITCRQSVMLGGGFLSLGYLLSSLATSIEIVILAQGVLTGLGAAFIHGPSIVILSKYFDKRRGLANSVTLSCGSLGGIVLPLLFHKLVEWYNLEGALMITSGLVLNITVAGTLMRPTSFYLNCYNIQECIISNYETNDYSPGAENMKKCETETISDGNYLQTVNKTTDCLNESESDLSMKDVKRLDIREYFGGSVSSLSIPVPVHNIGVDKSADDDIKCCMIACKDISHTFDCSLFRNAMFVSLLIGGVFAQLATALAHIFIPPYARDQGIASSDLSFIASAIGISEFFGRVILGLVADFKCIERHRFITMALFLTCVVINFVYFYDSFWKFIIFAIFYGAFGGAFLALYSPVCVDLLGLERLRNAFAISFLFQGATQGAFVPILGLLRDITGSYVVSFHVMGGSAFIAASILMLIPLARKYETRKNDREKDKAMQPLQSDL